MTSSEIKDKDAIISARKEIERRMERFKLVEKEAKTKSFSKEGLNRAAADPKERAKADMRDWLTATVDTLNSGIEEFEAEAEAAGTAKKGKKPPARVTLMEESIGRHRQHIMRLEQLLRLLDNDAVQGEALPHPPPLSCLAAAAAAAAAAGCVGNEVESTVCCERSSSQLTNGTKQCRLEVVPRLR
jgi:CCR4-NOT transcriptional regulation complex NOT5 subunit